MKKLLNPNPRYMQELHHRRQIKKGKEEAEDEKKARCRKEETNSQKNFIRKIALGKELRVGTSRTHKSVR